MHGEGEYGCSRSAVNVRSSKIKSQIRYTRGIEQEAEESVHTATSGLQEQLPQAKRFFQLSAITGVSMPLRSAILRSASAAALSATPKCTARRWMSAHPPKPVFYDMVHSNNAARIRCGCS